MDSKPKELHLNTVSLTAGCCNSSQTHSSTSVHFSNTAAACTFPCRPPSSSNSRAGQVSNTPHENEASHSEHQPHCPVLTPPLACVVLQILLCTLFKSSQLNPILSLLWLSQKKFCSLQEGRKNRKRHSFIITTKMQLAAYQSH